MALLERLVVSESSEVMESTESIAMVTGNTDQREKGETSSEAEDNSRTKQRRKKTSHSEERSRTKHRHKDKTTVTWNVQEGVHKDTAQISEKKLAEGQRNKEETMYRSVEIQELNLTAAETGTPKQKEDSHDSESSCPVDNHRGRRKKKKSKTKPVNSELFIDPLEQKYMELNELLMQDFIERKLSEHRGALGKLNKVYKPPGARLQGRPPIVPGSQQIYQTNTSQQPVQRKCVRINTAFDAASDTSTNDSRRKKTADAQSDQGTKLTLTKRRRPLSATIERRSRADQMTRNVRNGEGRSRSAGSWRLSRRGKLSGKSDRSESLSCGKTDNDTFSSTSPRQVIVPIDCHLKQTQNEEMLNWLKNKNKLLRGERQKRREKKRQQQKELMDKATAMYERSVLCKKETEEWKRRKQKEAWLKTKEEKMIKDLQNKTAASQNQKVLDSSREKLPPFHNIINKDKSSGQESTKPGSASLNKDDLNAQDRLKLEEEEQARKAAELRDKGATVSKTTFIYKRPVNGKIRFKMPRATKPECDKSKPKGLSEDERKEQARRSYDHWLHGKRNEELKRKKMERKKDNVLAESDPMVHVLSEAGKKRVQAVYERKKILDTGLQDKCDDVDRPEAKSSTESDKTKPKPSRRSPRRVHRRLENAMENDSKINPFVLPFPPELGVPRHVSAKQREIFAEKVWKTIPEETPAEHKSESAVIEDVANPVSAGKEQWDNQPETAQVNSDEESGNINRSPRYGFNRRQSPVSTSSSDNDAPVKGVHGENVQNTADNTSKEKTGDTDVLKRDSFFLTSLESP